MGEANETNIDVGTLALELKEAYEFIRASILLALQRLNQGGVSGDDQRYFWSTYEQLIGWGDLELPLEGDDDEAVGGESELQKRIDRFDKIWDLETNGTEDPTEVTPAPQSNS
jgi:hypothetical protein